MKKVLAVLAVAGLASSAMAQTFEGRVAFIDHHNPSVTPNINNGATYEYNAAGQTGPVTLNFAVMLGAFNAQGFDNHGMFAWLGDLSGTGTGFTLGNTPGPRGPFNFSPAGSGTVSGDGSAINGIDAVRNPLVSVPWDFGIPNPPAPNTSQGRDAYFSTFRFTVTLTDLSVREITFNLNGTMSALSGVTFLGGEEGDMANWTLAPAITGIPANGSFTLAIVPAPGAAALLGLGGLVAARRRRA